MTQIPISAIVTDAGTQVRAAIDDALVTDYAAHMTAGDVFPPIVLFYDGSRHYLADGFHRVLAATRNGLVQLAAEVRTGTKDDALWFALGANRANGSRLTLLDKRHAITIALQMWPDRSGRSIAEHIGCDYSYLTRLRTQLQPAAGTPDAGSSPERRVIGKDGKSYPAQQSKAGRVHPKHDEIVQRLKQGETARSIGRHLRVAPATVMNLGREAGLGFVDKSPDAAVQRRTQMRTLAAEGHTTRQIAKALGITPKTVQGIARDHQIDISANRAVGHTLHHDANRIIDRIVLDAGNITAGADLIDFEDVNRAQLPEWIAALVAARDQLNSFIRRLSKEQAQHGQVAHT